MRDVENSFFNGESITNMDNFYYLYTNIILGDNVSNTHGFSSPCGIIVFKQRLRNMAIFFSYSLRFLAV